MMLFNALLIIENQIKYNDGHATGSISRDEHFFMSRNKKFVP